MNGTPIYVSLSLSFVGARKPKSLLVSSSPNLDHSFSVDFDLHLRWCQDCYYKGDPISITPSSLSGFKADYVLFHRRTSKEEGKIEKDREREEFKDEFKDDFSLDPVLNTVASTSLLCGSMKQHGFTQLYIRVRSSQAAQQSATRDVPYGTHVATSPSLSHLLKLLRENFHRRNRRRLSRFTTSSSIVAIRKEYANQWNQHGLGGDNKPDGAFAQSRRGFHVDLGTREKDKSEGWSDSDRGISCTFGALLSVDQFLVCSFEILKPAPSSSCIALKKGSFKGGRPVVI
ncbi:unnamed protein product [Brassica napus]|uniref:(rape) hypothetical protein n=1 Tax=Brassica napus TaxID=3708 RepID=A0A816LP83_BRANA|nr:unnamed protein product [Brassica napus]